MRRRQRRVAPRATGGSRARQSADVWAVPPQQHPRRTRCRQHHEARAPRAPPRQRLSPDATAELGGAGQCRKSQQAGNYRRPRIGCDRVGRAWAQRDAGVGPLFPAALWRRGGHCRPGDRAVQCSRPHTRSEVQRHLRTAPQRRHSRALAASVVTLIIGLTGHVVAVYTMTADRPASKAMRVAATVLTSPQDESGLAWSPMGSLRFIGKRRPAPRGHHLRRPVDA
jgi:hypothetical protein